MNCMFDDLTELYQQVILDHSRSPRNFHKLEKASHSAHGHNPLCGDHYTIYTLMDGDRIKDISAINDESGREHKVRIVIDLKRDADPEVVKNQLLQFTPCRVTASMINTALVNRQPRVGLRDLHEYFAGGINPAVPRLHFRHPRVAHLLGWKRVGAERVGEDSRLGVDQQFKPRQSLLIGREGCDVVARIIELLDLSDRDSARDECSTDQERRQIIPPAKAASDDPEQRDQ